MARDAQPTGLLQTREIDGHTYQLAPLPAWSALDASHALGQILGPAGAAALATRGSDMKGEALAAAIASVFQANKPKDVRELAKLLLSNAMVTVDGKTVQLMPIADLHFQGRILSLFKVVAFAVEVNFGDFFAALKLVGKSLGARLTTLLSAASESESSSASSLSTSEDTGPAGG